jgi:hypothetical protein
VLTFPLPSFPFSPFLSAIHLMSNQNTYNYTEQQRERSRSPRRRSRSPRRRRSYSRSRSRSREDYRRTDRRSRSPMSGANSGAGGAPRRNPEDRAAAKDAMMQSIRDSSQQDRRVYVGNLSYDVKWHHLKDFMKQGMLTDGVFLGFLFG